MSKLLQLNENINILYCSAIKNIQNFELNLQVYFILKHVLQNNPNNQLDQEISQVSRISKRSFEQFSNILAKEPVPQNEIIGFLKNYNSTRLYLLHHFFIKNIKSLSTETGCQRHISELNCLNESFLNLRFIANNYYTELMCKYSFNKKDIVKIAINILTDT